MDIIKIENIEAKIITLREEKVILDSDVADLYGVTTKRINEALKNNLDKFPDGYVWEVSDIEKTKLVENFDRFNLLKHSAVYPKAFTEKALYMLATILKSKIATQTTTAKSSTKLIFKNKQIISSYRPHNDAILDNDLQTNESEINKNINNYNFMPNLQQVSKNYFTLLDVVSVRNNYRVKLCSIKV